ncbi:MAG: hypothetical protein KIS30_03675 [Thermoplasmata archaeon]|nr:hypothetical protein [Candidatus Sysuiplasma acidicola]MBX8645843.1 hypothetical protein [Candidatus Sysuiplasma acidicola]
MKKEVDMLTSEYASAIRLLEDIGRTGEKEDRLSSIQSAIKVLRMELDREMDLQEMDKLRREVVLLDPDSEPASETARRVRTAGSEKQSYEHAESEEPELKEKEADWMRQPLSFQRKQDVSGGLRSVEEQPSGARKSSVRETDTDRIRIKLSSMKIEKMTSKGHSDAEKSTSAVEQAPQDDKQGLVKCRNCGTMISKRSVVCVSCGEFIR